MKSNDSFIPSTLTFTEVRKGTTNAGKHVDLQLNTEYKVLEVIRDTKYNDYGYLVYTKLIIQRAGGKKVTIRWEHPVAVQC